MSETTEKCCKFCGEIFSLVVSMRSSGTPKIDRRKKFCNSSCAASFNNRNRARGRKDKRVPPPKHTLEVGKFLCRMCGIDIVDLYGNKVTPSSKGTEFKYCSNSCCVSHQKIQRELKYRSWYEGNTAGEEATKSKGGLNKAYKNYLKAQRNYTCEGLTGITDNCDWSITNPTSGTIPVHVDHIDGDACNNHISNLRVLCPSCHSLTSNHGSLNRGKGTRKP